MSHIEKLCHRRIGIRHFAARRELATYELLMYEKW